MARRQKQASDSGGPLDLATAAKKTGSFRRTVQYPGNGSSLATLRDLTSLSHLVFVGTVKDAVCALTADHHNIYTVEDVMVDTAVKGFVPSGTTVKIAIMGGRVLLPNNVTAEVVTKGLMQPQPNRHYAWAVRRAPEDLLAQLNLGSDADAYTLAFGPLGLYDLAPMDSGPVRPNGAGTGPLATFIAHWRPNPSDFVAALVSAQLSGR